MGLVGMLAAQVCTASQTAAAKQMLDAVFVFFIKAKILPDFFLLCKNWY